MSEWLNGPAFVRWIETHCDLRGLDDNRKRTLRHYRSGSQASLGSADRLLTALGRNLNELPEDMWEPISKVHRSPDIKEEATRALAEGAPVKQIARRYGVNPSTVRYWRKRAAA